MSHLTIDEISFANGGMVKISEQSRDFDVGKHSISASRSAPKNTGIEYLAWPAFLITWCFVDEKRRFDQRVMEFPVFTVCCLRVPHDVVPLLVSGDFGAASGGFKGALGTPGKALLGGVADEVPGYVPFVDCANTAAESTVPKARAGMIDLLMKRSSRRERIVLPKSERHYARRTYS